MARRAYQRHVNKRLVPIRRNNYRTFHEHISAFKISRHRLRVGDSQIVVSKAMALIARQKRTRSEIKEICTHRTQPSGGSDEARSHRPAKDHAMTSYPKPMTNVRKQHLSISLKPTHIFASPVEFLRLTGNR